MATGLKQISLKVKEKGLLECVALIVTIAINFVYSIGKIFILKIRGYKMEYSVRLASSSAFFQSKIGAISVGSGARIGRNTRINAGFNGTITIGHNTLIDDGTYLMAQDKISIGDNTWISAYCFITDFNHRYGQKNKTIISQGYKRKPVIIGDDVWIGTHVCILPGVQIGTGAVVGAGSVVTRSVAAYTVVAGNPAKPVSSHS